MSTVIAGLDTTSRIYPTCGTRPMRKSGKPDFRCDPDQAGKIFAFLSEMAGT